MSHDSNESADDESKIPRIRAARAIPVSEYSLDCPGSHVRETRIARASVLQNPYFPASSPVLIIESGMLLLVVWMTIARSRAEPEPAGFLALERWLSELARGLP